MPAPTIFISYSHDSDEHRERVLALSERLRLDGVETLLDQYITGSPPQGWPRWMLDQIDGADFVLIVCTEAYYRRFRGHEEPGKGKGVDWEGSLITQEIYDSRSRTMKFVPVLLSADMEQWIPEPLGSGTHYTVTSERGYQHLYDFLLQQAGVEPQPLGTLKPKPRRKGSPLAFDEPLLGGVRCDISRIMEYAPAELIGRESETKLLSDTWSKAYNGETARPRLLTFVALGGEGKTSLVAKWAVDLAHQELIGDGVFAWSFYSQGTRNQAVVSPDTFLKEALTFFGDPVMAASAHSAFDKGRRLAKLVGERRALLILDGLEPLQYAPTSPTPGELKDQGISALLKELAALSRGLCVVTTRYSIRDLRAYWQNTAPEVKLLRLSEEAGTSLLKKLGVKGNQQEFAKLVEDVNGHALTLNLMGSYLRDAHAGDIRKRDLVRLEEADAEEQGGHAFRVMDAYALWLESEGEKGRRALALLRLLGLFDRPASADCLDALLEAPVVAGLTEPLARMSEVERNVIFSRLESAKLLTVNRDPVGSLVSIDAHPLLREYLARDLRMRDRDVWRAAHRRLYEHLCATTKEGDRPTLEALQPLYQAVAHGCEAGMYEEVRANVFRDRIQRRAEAYSARRLGAFSSDLGAIACFFEVPWKRVSPALPEHSQAWLLNEAAFRLLALGRVIEAREPMRVTMEINAAKRQWEYAAVCAGNLAEVELTLGDIAAAVEVAKRSVSYADRTGNDFQRLAKRTNHATALHHAGRWAEAEARFREAERMQAESQPEYPLLYSLQGFRYCDLLLAEVERAAWQVQVGNRGSSSVNESSVSPKAAAVCHAVAQRGVKMLEWRHAGDPLLDMALDHLTLGRVALYQALLGQSDFLRATPDLSNIDQAMASLRLSGVVEFLPLGLLTRAWVRNLSGARIGPESAQSDLNEAWEIAERGPMPLILANIHLCRARLFGNNRNRASSPLSAISREIYPWESPQIDLAEARRLIEKHGYLRRKGELEDAENAAKSW